jgi:excisionase family DNA binding protein
LFTRPTWRTTLNSNELKESQSNAKQRKATQSRYEKRGTMTRVDSLVSSNTEKQEMATATRSGSDALFTRAEAAEYIGVKPTTLAAWALTGRYKLPVKKVGRLVRYLKSDLDKWLSERTFTHTGQAE